MEATSYAFAQLGGFSLVNENLRRELDAALAPVRSVALDIHRYRKRSLRRSPFAALGSAVWEYPLRDVVASSETARTTAWMFDRLSAAARAEVRAVDPRFVFQTQTWFDAAIDGVPFFLYTDHTVLAIERYPPEGRELFGISHRNPARVEQDRAVYARADHVFTSCEFARASLVEQYGLAPGSVTSVGNSFNRAGPAGCPVRTGPVRTFLFAGYDWERKGGPELIEAFRTVRARSGDARLVIAGARPELDEPGVTVLGTIGRPEMARWFGEADVFVMPSWVEPSAAVYLEAAAHGLPVVATTVGGTPERVLDGRTGLLCAPGDIPALARALLTLIDDPDRARRLGRDGCAFVEEWTWPAVGGRVADTLRQLGFA
jgi:glycosyltransferase involved in cell wall biosynthesis